MVGMGINSGVVDDNENVTARGKRQQQVGAKATARCCRQSLEKERGGCDISRTLPPKARRLVLTKRL